MAVIEDLAPLSTGDEDIPPLRMTETGYNGLMVLGGQVFEECNYELKWPWCVKTYKKMLKDGTIAPAVDYVQTMISRVSWDVKAPEGFEKELKSEVAFIKSIKDDMQHSWLSFIKQVTSFVPYGFAPFEVIPRYRLPEKGSRHNDGLVGIRKIVLRSQDTIAGWKYSNKGRDLSHITQRVNIPQNRDNYIQGTAVYNDNGKSFVDIPIGKMLLFRNNPLKDSPIGQSPLNSIWESWKYKKALEESEAQGIASDLHGFKVLGIPPQYMKPDATEEDKEVYEYYKKMMRNIHVGKESGMILPRILDENGISFFDFQVVSVTGKKAFDINQVIARYQKEILTALYADFLVLGQEGGGSFALSESKMSIVKMVIESKLEEIRDVLNHYLIPRLFKWNGWSTEIYPTFEYGEVSEISVAEFAKALQQAAATGNVIKNPENINAIQKKLGLPARVDKNMSQNELFDLLSPETTRSGDGMGAGLGSGTGKATGKSGDSSASNKNNK